MTIATQGITAAAAAVGAGAVIVTNVHDITMIVTATESGRGIEAVVQDVAAQLVVSVAVEAAVGIVEM